MVLFLILSLSMCMFPNCRSLTLKLQHKKESWVALKPKKRLLIIIFSLCSPVIILTISYSYLPFTFVIFFFSKLAFNFFFILTTDSSPSSNVAVVNFTYPWFKPWKLRHVSLPYASRRNLSRIPRYYLNNDGVCDLNSFCFYTVDFAYYRVLISFFNCLFFSFCN